MNKKNVFITSALFLVAGIGAAASANLRFINYVYYPNNTQVPGQEIPVSLSQDCSTPQLGCTYRPPNTTSTYQLYRDLGSGFVAVKQ